MQVNEDALQPAESQSQSKNLLACFAELGNTWQTYTGIQAQWIRLFPSHRRRRDTSETDHSNSDLTSPIRNMVNIWNSVARKHRLGVVRHDDEYDGDGCRRDSFHRVCHRTGDKYKAGHRLSEYRIEPSFAAVALRRREDSAWECPPAVVPKPAFGKTVSATSPRSMSNSLVLRNRIAPAYMALRDDPHRAHQPMPASPFIQDCPVHGPILHHHIPHGHFCRATVSAMPRHLREMPSFHDLAPDAGGLMWLKTGSAPPSVTDAVGAPSTAPSSLMDSYDWSATFTMEDLMSTTETPSSPSSSSTQSMQRPNLELHNHHHHQHIHHHHHLNSTLGALSPIEDEDITNVLRDLDVWAAAHPHLVNTPFTLDFFNTPGPPDDPHTSEASNTHEAMNIWLGEKENSSSVLPDNLGNISWRLLLSGTGEFTGTMDKNNNGHLSHPYGGWTKSRPTKVVHMLSIPMSTVRKTRGGLCNILLTDRYILNNDVLVLNAIDKNDECCATSNMERASELASPTVEILLHHPRSQTRWIANTFPYFSQRAMPIASSHTYKTNWCFWTGPAFPGTSIENPGLILDLRGRRGECYSSWDLVRMPYSNTVKMPPPRAKPPSAWRSETSSP
ncbi:hypothetical protein DFJ77DRAFT_442458 [Powellomyces hirtus]|nr:hypothetical protein DFJ77DRAFT_442458 [Powellomyces hirtus]